MELNQERLNEFLGRAVVDFGATLHAGLVVIGEKLGLYKALANGSGPLTPAELAVLVLEQTFEQPVTTEELDAGAKRVDKCLEQYGARWMRSYLSKDRKRMVCEFEAPDAEQVRPPIAPPACRLTVAGPPICTLWTSRPLRTDIIHSCIRSSN